MGTEKWALGILDRGDRKTGEMMYLYSKSRSRRETPRMARGAMSRTMNKQERWR